ncbi:ABC transporter permease [Luteipulveratus flavus]|uniref:ABC transporter permease n=1 Tax=Luteipulveratus flavus TaxID=3031728 RepID=A0ABT6C7P0_9MICO|nr:ABC transporter permease [Luteipulveratus sp. YIM 133296]MDF8264922.1 ABC transporter permease [Luteipulveratus sp. YIM 133296]
MLALLSMVVTACAVFAPVYQHSLRESLVKARLTELAPVNRDLTLRSSVNPRLNDVSEPESFDVLADAVPADLRAAHGLARREARAPVSFDSAPLTMLSVDGMCQHVRIVSGRCPGDRKGEALVSDAQAKVLHWKVGDRVALSVPVVVVGTYAQPPSDPYWGGEPFNLGTGARVQVAPNAPHPLDTVLVSMATLDGAGLAEWSRTISFPIRDDGVTAGNLPSLAASAQRLADGGHGLQYVDARTSLPTVLTAFQEDEQQAGVIVLVTLVQLLLLVVVVLRLVLAAAVEQRRREMALARLRGLGQRGARELVARELGLPLLLGVPLGVLLALAVDQAARAWWLVDRVPYPFTWTILLAVVVATALLAGTLLLSVLAGRSQTIGDQLRGVPERSKGWGLRVMDAVVLSAATVAVVAAATGNVEGPVALITPGVLALAIGLVLAHLVIPVAALLGRRLRRRGQVARSLASLQVARRPAVRRLVTVVTIGTALVVFSANAIGVADENRANRAAAEVGAPLVLTVDQSQRIGTALADTRKALRSVDPTGQVSTPMLQLYPPSDSAPSLTAVDPVAYERIATTGGRTLDIAGLSTSGVKPPRMRGFRLTTTISMDSLEQNLVGLGKWSPFTSATSEITDENGKSSTVTATPPHLRLSLTTGEGTATTVDLGAVPGNGLRATTRSVDVPCSEGCRIDGLTLAPNPPDRFLRTGITLRGRIRLTGMRTNVGPVAGMNDLRQWVDKSSKTSSDDHVSLRAVAGGLGLNWLTQDNTVTLKQRAGLERGSAIMSQYARDNGELAGAYSGGAVQLPSLAGSDVQYRAIRVWPFVPGSDLNTALVPIEVVTAKTERLDDAKATLKVLSSDASPANEARLTQALAKVGVPVLEVDRVSTRKEAYDRSASAWGLQLGQAVAVASLLVALLVILVAAVTSWRERSRDFGSLRLAGVPVRDLRRAAVLEQSLVVGLAVVLGAVAGVIGSALSLKRIPLFAVAPDIPVVHLETRWWVVLAVTLALGAALVAASIAVARAIVGRATLVRAKESV